MLLFFSIGVNVILTYYAVSIYKLHYAGSELRWRWVLYKGLKLNTLDYLISAN